MARERTVNRAAHFETDEPMASVKKTPSSKMGRLASRDPKSLKTLGHFGGIGFEMAVFAVLGVKGGQWLDAYFGTSFLTLLGLALGLFAGFRSLAQLTRKLGAAEDAPAPLTAETTPAK